MLLPTTSAGIGYLNAGAPWSSQGVGCDFACRSVNSAQVPPNYQMQLYTFNLGTPAVLSSPFGTMTDVSTSRKTTFPDQDVSAALNTLFSMSVPSARLIR